jgi:hypothetical protein
LDVGPEFLCKAAQAPEKITLPMTYVAPGRRAKRRNGAANWRPRLRVPFRICDKRTTPYGNLGDLQLAAVEDGSGNVLDASYYRYYTPADAGSVGYVGGLKYAFSSVSYRT